MTKDLRIIVLLCGIGFFLATPLRDHDLFWHLTIGRWIVAHGQLPHEDLWTMVGQGVAWRPYSWLFEVSIGLLYSFGGLSALVWTQALLGILLAVSIGALLITISSAPVFGFFMTSAAILGSAGHFALRPQSIIWILFCALLFLGHKIQQRQTSIKMLICLAGVMMLWANLHLSAPFGIAVFIIWLIGSVGPLQLLIYTTIGIASTFITPHLGGEWLTLIEKSSHPLTHQTIAEFQPANIFQFPTAILLILWLVFLVLAWRKRYAPPGVVLAMLFTSAAGAIAIKFVPFALITLSAGISHLWAIQDKLLTAPTIDPADRIFIGISKLIEGFSHLPTIGLCFFIFAIMYVKATKLHNAGFDSKTLPMVIGDYLKNHPPKGSVLASFGYGGFVEHFLANEAGEINHKVAFDGRTNLIPSPVWEEIEFARSGRETKWRLLLERFNPVYVVWDADSAFVTILKLTGWQERARSTLDRNNMVLLERQ